MITPQQTTKRFYVYKLIDSITGLPFYVGKGSGDRMFQHVRSYTKIYKTATHNNMLLKNKIAKILQHGGSVKYQRYLCRNEEQALLIEQLLIKKYGRRDKNTGILCNMTDGGEGVSGHSRSATWRQQSRERRIQAARGYDQYTLDGTFIQSFNTIYDLKKVFPTIDAGALSLCVNNKNKSSLGFRWTWKDIPLLPYVSKSTPRPHTGKHFRPVQQYTTTGKYINTFPSLVSAAISVGKHPNTLLECCRGRSKTASGFVWKYV